MNRCYDCLVMIPFDDLLCPKCAEVYAAGHHRRKLLNDGREVPDEQS